MTMVNDNGNNTMGTGRGMAQQPDMVQTPVMPPEHMAASSTSHIPYSPREYTGTTSHRDDILYPIAGNDDTIYKYTSPYAHGTTQSRNHAPSLSLKDYVSSLAAWKKAVAVIVVAVSLLFTVSVFQSIGGSQMQAPVEPAPVAVEQEPEEPNTGIDLTGIEGQYWSNAKKILESRNADMSGMLVLTNNGKTPLLDSNWKVESISRQPDGHLEVHLTQLTDYAGEAGETVNSLKDKAQNAWNDITKENK